MHELTDTDAIRTHSCPTCSLCGAEGVPLYHGLRDRIFDAPNQWSHKRCPVSKCGVAWLDPMPDRDDLGKAYRTYYTHEDILPKPSTILRRFYERARKGYLACKYGYEQTSSVTDRLLGRLMYLYPPGRADLDLKVFCLNARSGGSLLEVGCGSGDMLKWMQEQGWQVQGVDFDQKAVRNAEAKGLLVHFGSLNEQEFPDNCFDAIAMNHVIEHVPDPASLLQECHRILKPGGILVVITPNFNSLGHYIFKSSWFPLDPPRHLLLFTANALWRTADVCRFSTLKIFSSIRGANGLFMASYLIRRSGRSEIHPTGTFALRLWARFMQFVELIALRFVPLAGEEIVLIARK